MVRAFSRPACRDFMLIHDSDGVEWFNKERFEELAEWLAVIGLVKLALKRPAGRTVSAWLAAAGRELAACTALAAHAGYRSRLLQQLIGTAGESRCRSSGENETKERARMFKASLERIRQKHRTTRYPAEPAHLSNGPGCPPHPLTILDGPLRLVGEEINR